VPHVVFPCGTTLLADGDTIHMYYGGADSCIALATGSVSACLAWLEQHGSAPPSIGAPPMPSAT